MANVSRLRAILLWLGVTAFFVGWIWIFIRISRADGKPPKFDRDVLYGISVIGGVLGTFFAVSMGVQRKDPNTDARKLQIGKTLVAGEDTTALSARLATWTLYGYAAVGILAIIFSKWKSLESPDLIKGQAATFAGYIAALVTAAFAPGQAGTPN